MRLSNEADLIVCDFLAPSLNVPNGLTAPVILFQHNVEATIWWRHASVPQNPFRRIYMRGQWRRMVRYEAEQCRRFSGVVAVSAIDAEFIRSNYAVDSVSYVSTGVDLEYFSASRARPNCNGEMVFVGSMDWMPNDDGIRWFASEVFGLVQQLVPDARLTVVGRLPSQGMQDLAARNKGIVITGTVPDVRPYLERAAVCVVPLRIGGGTRLKIYEAMAMGIAIVSTTIGAEGLPVRDNEHLLIADSPEALARAIVGLLKDPARASRLAGNAMRFVREHCSWDAVSEEFLSQCVAQSTTRADT